jgi:thioesterase domain-containing protein/acyl carrier protein
MVPSAFVSIPAIPLTRNGKLDVHALPSAADYQMERAYEAPRDPAEQSLQQLWQKVLRIARIGIRDNFFELGGDSLAAMRMVNTLNNDFKADLPIRALFEHPTIEALAAALSDVGCRREGILVPLQPGGSRPKLFCIHPAGGHIFCYLPLAHELGTDQPVFGLQARGLEEGEPLATSIEGMAADYIEAIRAIEPDGPYQLLGISSGGLVAFEMARRIKQSGGEVGFLALLDTTIPASVAGEISQPRFIKAMAHELGCADLITDAEPTVTLAQLVDQGHAAGRLPSDFCLAQAERIAAVFRNMIRIYSDYPLRKWDGPMLLLRALRRSEEADSPPDWSPHVTGSLEVVDLDCAHMDLASAAWSPKIAALVASRLARIDERRTHGW